MRAPSFWWREPGWESALLTPLGAAYGAVAARRMRRQGAIVGIPVICVGNPTLGGAGKTPTAIAIAALLAARGEQPFLLSRGYGGALPGPVRVDAAVHRAADIGDEPLLLAAAFPTIVARDRVAGAQAARAAGASVVVMDDGFQNPSLGKRFSLLVVDARRGLGNGRVFPAGPLRARAHAQFERADAVLLVGEGSGGSGIHPAGIPIFRGSLRPDPAVLSRLRGHRLLAFAGIGDPEKFFATLIAAGLTLASRRPFGDHHRYTNDEARHLLEAAERDGLQLATTEKDLVRLAAAGPQAELRERALALPVTLKLEDEAGFCAALFASLRTSA